MLNGLANSIANFNSCDIFANFDSATHDFVSDA